MARLPRSGPVTVEVPGGPTFRMWSRGDDNIATRLFWRGFEGFEPETAMMFARLARGAGVVLDVGAHVGYFSLLAASTTPTATVYAFEPLPQVASRLKRNIRLNALTNVVHVPAAAGAENGIATLHHAAAGIPSDSTLADGAFVENDAVATTTVPVIRVDDFAAERGLRIDLMKVDTERTEPDVLHGMSATLQRDRPAIVCEVLEESSVAASLEAELSPFGYEYHLLTSAGPVHHEAIEPHPIWRNWLFVPVERADELVG
jgi:FkbM family methyltransferase